MPHSNNTPTSLPTADDQLAAMDVPPMGPSSRIEHDTGHVQVDLECRDAC